VGGGRECERRGDPEGENGKGEREERERERDGRVQWMHRMRPTHAQAGSETPTSSEKNERDNFAKVLSD
jgi:hypothetical protein